jgi:hypothetical protein
VHIYTDARFIYKPKAKEVKGKMQKRWRISKWFAVGGFLLATALTCHAGTVFQLTETSTIQDVVLQNEKMQAQLSYTMVKGDFNGDNIDDFALGAPRETGPRSTDEVGAVMVFMGGASLNSLPADVKTGVTSTDEKESARLYGTDAGDWAGAKLAAGDLNNDGIDDLVIGNKDANFTNTKIWVVFGKSGLSGDIKLDDADVILQRPDDSLNIGALGIGDVNGDGKDDLVIADNLSIQTNAPPMAPMNEGHTSQHIYPDDAEKSMNGAVYVVFGDLAAGTVDLITEANTYILRSDGTGLFQVSSIAIGDMSGDGKNDLVLGAQKEDNPIENLEKAGAVYIINGGTEFPTEKVVDIDTVKDTVIYGGWKDDQIGGPYDTETTSLAVNGRGSLAIGDVNNDSMNDLIIGSPLSMLGNVNSTGRGKVEVVYGKSSLGASIDLYTDADIRLMLSESAQKMGFKTGFAVSADDVNGDGIADISASTPNANSKSFYNGWVHVLYGGTELADKLAGAENKTLELDISADLGILAAEPPDKFSDGRMGATFLVGDFNNSGTPDMIVGAHNGNLTNDTSAGWAAILWDAATKGMPGDISGNWERELSDAILGFRIAAGENISVSISIGADVNGDKKLGIPEAIFTLNDLAK